MSETKSNIDYVHIINEQLKRIKKLESARAKLVECLKGFVETSESGSDYPESCHSRYARQCLKDLGIGEGE